VPRSHAPPHTTIDDDECVALPRCLDPRSTSPPPPRCTDQPPVVKLNTGNVFAALKSLKKKKKGDNDKRATEP
jgi:hypothetical protein